MINFILLYISAAGLSRGQYAGVAGFVLPCTLFIEAFNSPACS
jgi:hypothetical protein